jgi:hypothetical protein
MFPRSIKKWLVRRRPEALAIPFNLQTLEVFEEAHQAEAEFGRYEKEFSSFADFWRECPRADWMLQRIDRSRQKSEIEKHYGKPLRLFACWCARHAGAAVGDETSARLLATAEEFASGIVTSAALDEARARGTRGACAAGIQGLPRFIPTAAAQLAVWHTTNQHALDAARLAAYFAARGAGCVAAEAGASSWVWPDDRRERWQELWKAAYFARAHADVIERAEGTERRRQAEVLRFMVQPFLSNWSSHDDSESGVNQP